MTSVPTATSHAQVVPLEGHRPAPGGGGAVRDRDRLVGRAVLRLHRAGGRDPRPRGLAAHARGGGLHGCSTDGSRRGSVGGSAPGSSRSAARHDRRLGAGSPVRRPHRRRTVPALLRGRMGARRGGDVGHSLPAGVRDPQPLGRGATSASSHGGHARRRLRLDGLRPSDRAPALPRDLAQRLPPARHPAGRDDSAALVRPQQPLDLRRHQLMDPAETRSWRRRTRQPTQVVASSGCSRSPSPWPASASTRWWSTSCPSSPTEG